VGPLLSRLSGSLQLTDWLSLSESLPYSEFSWLTCSWIETASLIILNFLIIPELPMMLRLRGRRVDFSLSKCDPAPGSLEGSRVFRARWFLFTEFFWGLILLKLTLVPFLLTFLLGILQGELCRSRLGLGVCLSRSSNAESYAFLGFSWDPSSL
jgi:hypothetical protein